MNPHRNLLRKVVIKGPPKKIAIETGIPESTLYHWYEEGQYARTNPLEHLVIIYQCTGDRRLVVHFCNECGGYFVPNAPADPLLASDDLVKITGRMDDAHADFEKALARVKKQGGFTQQDQRRVRKRWNRYQSKVEGLLRAARHGRLAKKLTAWLLTLWPAVEMLTDLAAACG
jgi:hypothetical protein